MNKKFLISLAVLVLVGTVFTLPMAHALPTRKIICFVFSPAVPAVFVDGDVDIVWVGVVKSSTYGKFRMAVYRDADDHGIHVYTENEDAGEIYADLEDVIYPGLYPKESVEVAEINLTLEKHYLEAVIKVGGAVVFTAEFWADENARLERFVESPPNDNDGFFSVSLRRPLTDATVSGLEVGSFWGGAYYYLDLEHFDSSLLP